MSEKYINDAAYSSTGYTLSGDNAMIVVGPKGVVGGTYSSYADGGVGITQPSTLSGTFSLANKGTITGGVGGYVPSLVDEKGFTYDGGAGIDWAGGGLITNTGQIAGGKGGSGEHGDNGTPGASGGAGIILRGAATLDNTGRVAGGSGGHGGAGQIYGPSPEPGGDGGYGVGLLDGGQFANHGAVSGGGPGAGGSIDFFGTTYSAGPGLAGDGVFVQSGEVINYHAGRIDGRIGVSAGRGGSATVINYGVISGSGVSVDLGATDRLIVESGARFVGSVIGGGGTLEFANGEGTIEDIGSSAVISGTTSMTIAGFGGFVIDSGATWSLLGANTLSSGQSFTAAGSATIAGSLEVSSGATMTDALTLAGGVLIDDGVVTFDRTAHLAGTLSGDGELFERGPGTLVLAADDPGFTGRAIISGGTLELYKPDGLGGGVVQFDIAASTLELISTSEPARGATFATTLLNFDKTGEAIDLHSQAYVAGAHAVLLSGDLLKLADGAYSAEFRLSGSTASSYPSRLTVTSDGHGGTLIEVGTAMAPAAPGDVAVALAHAMASFNAVRSPGLTTLSSGAAPGSSPLIDTAAASSAGRA